MMDVLQPPSRSETHPFPAALEGLLLAVGLVTHRLRLRCEIALAPAALIALRPRAVAA
jgi:hypothetical protein